MADIHTASNTSVELFINDIYNHKASFQWSKEDVQKQERFAEALVKDICDQINHIDPQFNIRPDLIKTGSYYDGTKVAEPNEFDFLCLLDHLSNELKVKGGTLTLEKGCQEGYAHIQVTNNKQLYEKCIRHQYLHEERFQAEVCNTSKGCEDWNLHHGLKSHCTLLVETALFELQKRGKVSIIELDRLEERSMKEHAQKGGDILSPGWDKYLCLPHPGLRPYNVFVQSVSRGPNIWPTVGSPIDGKRLDIDITFGLVHPSDELNPVLVPWCPESVCQDDVLFLPSPSCWSMSFNQAEKELVQQMQAPHKKLLMVLKYLVGEMTQKKHIDENLSIGYATGTHLYSHVLKHAMLHHNETCRCCSPGYNAADCVEKVLDMLINIFKDKSQKPKLCDYIQPSRNILDKHVSESSARQHFRWMNTPKMLNSLQILFRDIDKVNVEDYNFKACLIRLDKMYSLLNEKE